MRYSKISLQSLVPLIGMVLLLTVSLACSSRPKQTESVKKHWVVPFEYFKKKIIVSATIDGKGPFDFVLDTGVHPSGLDLSVAKELGLKFGEIEGFVAGFGKDQNPYRRMTLGLALEELVITDLKALTFDMAHLKIEGRPVHGILGHDFLRRFATRIDYGNQQLTFFNALPPGYPNPRDPETFVQCTFSLDGGLIPRVDNLMVEGHPISSWLDTGAGTTLSLSTEAARSMGMLASAQRGETITARGSRGEFGLYRVNFASIGLCSKQQRDVVGMIFQEGGHNIVGNDFLDEYIVTFDYGNRQLYLQDEAPD